MMTFLYLIVFKLFKHMTKGLFPRIDIYTATTVLVEQFYLFSVCCLNTKITIKINLIHS